MRPDLPCMCAERRWEGSRGASGKTAVSRRICCTTYTCQKSKSDDGPCFIFTHMGQPRSFFVRNFQVLAFVRQRNIIALYFRPTPFQVVPISRVFPFPYSSAGGLTTPRDTQTQSARSRYMLCVGKGVTANETKKERGMIDTESGRGRPSCMIRRTECKRVYSHALSLYGYVEV